MITKFEDGGGSSLEINYNDEFVTLTISNHLMPIEDRYISTSYELDKADLFLFVGQLLQLQKKIKGVKHG